MPIRKIQFENGEFYHVFNRGVEKRKVFMGDRDYLRFIKDLYQFNDTGNYYLYRATRSHNSDATWLHDPVVDILSFCLMPNHFHLLVKQTKEKGISVFMQKITGYVSYFNTKYKRIGSLFQGPFKAVHIDGDEQLKHVSRYIHLNPIELVESNWKENGIKDWDKASRFLENYRWSSYLDYIGKKNFPSVTNRGFLMAYFNHKPEKYKEYVSEWVVDDLEKINVLEQ